MAELSGEALDALAQAISGRLQAVVPRGASPSIAANVWMQLDLFVDRDMTLEANLVHASHNILNHVQDEIILDLKEGWPRAVDATPGERDSGENLPDYEAAVISGTLRLWFGDARRPALELPPIDLTELGITV